MEATEKKCWGREGWNPQTFDSVQGLYHNTKVYHTVFDMHCALFNLYCSARISGYQDQVIKTIANNVGEIDVPVVWW